MRAKPPRHVTLSRTPDLDGAARLAGTALLDRAWLRHAYGLGGKREVLVPAMAVVAAEVPDFTPTPLFDPAWVRRWATGAPDSVFALLEHYLAALEPAGISANPFFPPTLYAAAVPDAGSPLRYAAAHGGYAAVYFDTAAYRAAFPDDADALDAMGLPPFAHYVRHGWRDGQAATPLFDDAWYASQNPDVAAAIARGEWPNGFSHFLHVGEAEGRAPNPFFDPAAYLDANPDIAERLAQGQLWSAFRHWHDTGRPDGWRNRRQPAPAAASACAFMQDAFPGGADRDALLAAGRAYAATGGVPAAERVAAEAVYRRRAQPIVAIDRRDLPNPVPGEPPCRAHLSGVAVMPFHPLHSVTVGAAPPGLAAAVVQWHRVTLPEFLEEDPFGLAVHGELRPGFLLELAVAAAPGVAGPQSIWLCFGFAGGRQAMRRVIITPGMKPQAAPPAAVDAEVCMAAYAPPAALFAAQCRTALAQDGATLRLLISDDATPAVRAAGLQAGRLAAGGRAVLSVAGENRGFVANFERALRMAPGGRPVLLADQDDCWHADKARTLLAALSGGAALAFSDMRIVDRNGAEVSPSFWRQRRVHHRNPVSLAVANAVTGAASALSPGLVAVALPFPRYHAVFHDMWLAVAAAAMGPVAYVPRALHDYVQHDGNELGFSGSRRGTDQRGGLACRLLHRMAGKPPAQWTARECDAWLWAGTLARECLAPRWVLLTEAMRRFERWHDAQAQDDARVLLGLLTQPQPPRAVRAAWRRVRREGGGGAGLLGLDLMLGAALGAGHIAAQCDGPGAAARLAAHLAVAAPRPAVMAAVPSAARSGRRYTVLLPDLVLPQHRVPSFADAPYLRLAMAARLLRSGATVRLVVPGQAAVPFEIIANLTAFFPEFSRLMMDAEISCGFSHLPVGAREALVATDRTTAALADAMSRELGQAGFLYVAVNAEDAVAAQAWPRGLPVMADHLAATSAVRLPLPLVVPVRVPAPPPTLLAWLDQSDPCCLHEVALAALRLVARRLGPAAQEWRFVAVGATTMAPVALADGVWLHLEPGIDRHDYAHVLGAARAGLVLAHGAQHGAVALEMAAAGFPVVTAAPKPLGQPGMVVAAPAAAAVADALLAAMARRRARSPWPAAAPDWLPGLQALADAATRPKRR